MPAIETPESEQVMECHKGEFIVSTDPARIELDVGF